MRGFRRDRRFGERGVDRGLGVYNEMRYDRKTFHRGTSGKDLTDERGARQVCAPTRHSLLTPA